jgi:spore coat protein U-like protein
LRSILVLCVVVPFLALLVPEAANANVVCLVGTANLDMGTSSSGTGSITYTCTNYETGSQDFTLCVGLGTPSWPGTAAQPQLRGTNNQTIAYNVYRDAGASETWTGSQPLKKSISIPGGIGTSSSGSIPFYAKQSSGQSPPSDTYQAFFYNMVLGFSAGNSNNCSTSRGRLSGQQFTLAVFATVSNDCRVTAAGPADLGIVTPSSNPASGGTAINVNCPTGTAYTIGLRPSNGSTIGAGILSGSGGNTDTIPYQLRKQSANGPIWGNTASVGSVGNGVAGVGTGSGQNYPVFVTVPGTAYAPDTYHDTVLVTVYY